MEVQKEQEGVAEHNHHNQDQLPQQQQQQQLHPHHHESLDLAGSPLELLSNAAAAILETSRVAEGERRLLEERLTKDITDHELFKHHQLQKSTSCKELPTKESKMKRSKDRREINVSQTAGPRLKRPSSPPQSLCIDESPVSELVIWDALPHRAQYTLTPPNSRKLVSSPDAAASMSHMSLYRREQSSSGAVLSAYRGSPYVLGKSESLAEVSRRNSDPATAVIASALAQQRIEEVGDEQPLDFSKKSRNNSSESESRLSLPRSDESSSPISYTPPATMAVQQRPSVITRAPSFRNESTGNSGSVSPTLTVHHRALSFGSSHHSDDLPSYKAINRSQDTPSLPNNQPPPPSYHEAAQNRRNHHFKHHHKHTVAAMERLESKQSQQSQLSTTGFFESDIDDPVMDHFRRSLGDKFPDINSKAKNGVAKLPPATVSTSVDDHFAKALGPNWAKLQKKDDDKVAPTPEKDAESKIRGSPQSVAS